VFYVGAYALSYKANHRFIKLQKRTQIKQSGGAQ
jgi:hypothetical protein